LFQTVIVSTLQKQQQQQQSSVGDFSSEWANPDARAGITTATPTQYHLPQRYAAGVLHTYMCMLLLLCYQHYFVQAIQAFTSSLQAAYTTQLLPMGIDSVNVTQLICNGDSIGLTHTAQWDGWPGAAMGRRRLQQLSVTVISGSSVEGAMQTFNSIDLSVKFEIHRHDYVSDINDAAEWGSWMDQTRREAAAASALILPKLLGDHFKVTLVSDSLLVTQLPTVVVTSRAAPSGVTGRLEVTRTTSDPITGAVLDKQTMVVTAPGAADDNRSSSSSSGSNATAGSDAQDASSDDDTKDAKATDKTGSSSSSSTAGSPPAENDSSVIDSNNDGTCGSCTLRNAIAGCVQGSCVVSRCLPGWQDCDGLAATGCEADVLTFFSNSAHCGGCGKICLAPLTCSAGKCGLPQSAGMC
jgi:hypothetical protein